MHNSNQTKLSSNCFKQQHYRTATKMSLSPVTSLIIPSVAPNISAGDIARIFYKLDIATIRTITLLPVEQGNKAYIQIGIWHDTEAAYHFIERVRNPDKDARIVYDDPSWWLVMENKNNYYICYDPKYNDQTTYFIHNYGEEPVEAIKDVKAFFENPPILSVYDDYEVLCTIDIDDYSKPILLKEQKDDSIFNANDWNKFMEDIVNEDDEEEYRKAIELETEWYENYRDFRHELCDSF
jgi:hypothetical protein